MDTTPNLALPYIMAAQAQKHVTHNEAIRALDCLVQLAVADRDLTTPPASPVDGSRYIVAAGASGAWLGKSGKIAAFQDGAWAYFTPAEGWVAWISDENVLVAWDGTAWTTAGGASTNPTPLLGVNTTADTNNRLAVSSPASLFNHEGGSHRLKINKAAAADTGSMLFQTGFSGRAEMGLAGDDDYHFKVSPDGATWHEAIVIDRTDGSVSFPSTAPASVADSAVLNPYLRRAWAKAAQVMLGQAGARLNTVMLGDSIAGLLHEVISARLKLEYGNGGFAGRLAGESGFLDDGNGTNITQVDGDYTNSPIGLFWNLAAGGSKYWGVGNSNSLNPMSYEHPSVFLAPSNVTRIGIWYTRRPGGGVFKVQTSTKGAVGTYADVAGLTAIDTNGVLGVQYQEVTIASRDVFRLRIEHVSGGNCYVLGGLAAADVGVVSHSWTKGGLALTQMVLSPRFAELAALIPADLVTTSYLDTPGNVAQSAGMTPAQMHDGILNTIRNVFPATVVPPSIAPWAGKTALLPHKPDFTFFGGNDSETGLADNAAANAAIKANAMTNGDCFVDVTRMWGAWRNAWDMGMMSEGDGAGGSTHARSMFYNVVASIFLRETSLINGAYVRTQQQQKIEKLQVGPGTPGGDGAPGLVNSANKIKFGTPNAHVSLAPGDTNEAFGTVLALLKSDAPIYGAGAILHSTAAGGKRYLVVSAAGGDFQIRDLDSGHFFSFNSIKQLRVGAMSGATIMLGENGSFFSRLRHGTATLAAGVVTVTDANITANSRINVTRRARGGTVGATYEAIPAAGSFTVTARTAADAVATADTSALSWMAVEP